MQSATSQGKRSAFAGLGRNVIILGFVSLFTDISSEMLYPVIPIFLTTVLHAPMSVVGLIEGVAESTASLLKILFGWLSDRLTRRKPFVIAGYALSAVSKPLLALAGSWHLVLGSRMVDRLGKGIRTSPRDALIASSCDADSRGRAFGLHRAMDTTGAVIGPVLAVVLLSTLGYSYRSLFLLAFIPAVLGVGALLFVRETARAAAPATADAALPHTGRRFDPDLLKFLAAYAIFALGNSSDVFLLLRAKDIGLSTNGVLMTYVFYNAVYAMAATPAGWLSDKLSRTALLVGGLSVFSVVYVGFALATETWMIWPLFAFYGFYGAATEGVSKALVADLSHDTSRGTAMGLMHTVTGILALVASIAAGQLWSRAGPAAPFFYGAICALASAVALVFLSARRSSGSKAK